MVPGPFTCQVNRSWPADSSTECPSTRDQAHLAIAAPDHQTLTVCTPCTWKLTTNVLMRQGLRTAGPLALTAAAIGAGEGATAAGVGLGAAVGDGSVTAGDAVGLGETWTCAN